MSITCNYCGHETEHVIWGLLVRCVRCPDGRCRARENPECLVLWRCLGTDGAPHDEIQFHARAADDPHCWYCDRSMLPGQRPGVAA
jgi:hypothetical protein